MNDDIYSGFSNYKEINLDDRKNFLDNELEQWKGDKNRFLSYRVEWNRAANSDYLPEFPLHIDIELSDVCNLRCEMCAHGMGTVDKSGFMDDDLVYRLIDECALIGTYSIKFNWRGESTLNPLLPKVIEYAKEKGILEVSINTNGLPKDENILIESAEMGIDRMIFSVDGFSSETFESIRVGGDYNKLVENILRLVEWKKQNNKDKPLIRVQMVRSKRNTHEVNLFIEFWSDKVQDVRISDVMDRGQGEHLAVGDQITIGRRRCPQPFQRLVVGRDGRVSPCCADWLGSP